MTFKELMNTYSTKSNFNICLALLFYREHIMTFYDYLLNIDINVYDKERKEKLIVESLVIRLDDTKKLLDLISKNMSKLTHLDEKIEEHLYQ